MATIVNNPPSESNSSGLSTLIAGLLLLSVLFLLFYYGLPALRNGGLGRNSSPTFSIPKDVNINVNPNTNTNPAPPSTP